MLIYRLLIFICLFTGLQWSAFGQAKNLLQGKVVNESNAALQFVTISVDDVLLSTQSNAQGEFSISIPASLDAVTLKFSMVGKMSETRVIKKENYAQYLRVTLKDLSLTLKEINISPVQQHTINSNSSIVFDEEAIERIQAFSLMDILNTIPGKSTSAPNIDNPQNITLRGNQGGAYDANNSLGVAIIMDGFNLSNDANMQTRSVSQFGMLASTMKGVNGSVNGDVPFTGIDLREIPVETIEKVEVIQGVASAQYAELTDGAILIDRKAAATPWSFVTNVNGGSTNFSLTKGLQLKGNLGALNLGLNYAISNPDPKDKIKQYDRFSPSLMWSTRFHPKIKNTFSLDYSNRTDQMKMDPDDDSDRKSFSKNTGIRLANRLNWKLDLPYAKSLNFNISYSESNQHSFNQFLINGSPKGYSYKDTTGIYEGILLSGRYVSQEEIIGKPVTASANINLSADLTLGEILHVFSYGFSSNYSNNGGKGIVADPDRPRWVNLSGQNARPYSFEYLDPLINYGFFISDTFKSTVGSKALQTNLGFRIDQQNGSWSLQPRLSTVIKWNNKLDFTAAFGISSKSPTMAHRYPAPTFLDIPLILAYNSEDALYLVYTEKYLADNSHLKPSKSQQAEIGMRYKHSSFNTSLNAFWKNNSGGFSAIKQYKTITVPEYEYYFDEQKREILYHTTGNFISYFDLGDFNLGNNLNSISYGVDWMISTEKIRPINTSLNFSTSLIFSKENPKVDDIVVLKQPLQINAQDVWYMVYPASSKNLKTNMMSKLGSTTHIPQLGFVVMTNLDFYWLRNTSSKYGVKIQKAIGYLDADGNQQDFPQGMENLPVRDLSLSNVDLPFFYGSLNLSVAKEIKKKFRIAVTAYNVLNIQPENIIYSETNTEKFTVEKFNSPLSITGGISMKF